MPDINWSEILRLIPVVAGSVNPAAGIIAQQVMNVANAEIERRQRQQPSLTREQIVAESNAKLDQGLDVARKLRQKGHE